MYLLVRQRLRDELSATELDELIERKASGEHFSEDRLYELDLDLELEFLLRQRRGELLSATATEREGKTDVDEVRIYKLDLIKRHDLTPDEALDLAFCHNRRTSRNIVTEND